MTGISFFDLASVNAPLAADLGRAASEAIASGWFILGRRVEAFEAEFAAYTGVSHAIGVASGLDALALTLRAWKQQGKLRDGDGVVVAANTYIASILAITESGLTPVLVEPDEATFNLSVEGVRSVLSQKPKAVMAVHLYGQLCPMPQLRALCDENGMLLLEDSAQAHGAVIDGRKAGTFGHAAGFSFYPSKNLGALGDGGAITTADAELADLLRKLRNYGSHRKYYHEHVGINSRLDEMQAAFLSVKLPHLDAGNARRREIARRYRDGITNRAVMVPSVEGDEAGHVWHLFVVRCSQREELFEHLLTSGIHAAIHYPVPPHLQPCYREALAGYDLPMTERLHKEVLSLPMSPALTDDEVQRVIAVTNAFHSDLKANANG